MCRELTVQVASLISPDVPSWEALITSERKNAYIVSFVNPYSVYVARKIPVYLDLLGKFDAILADGGLMAKAASRLNNCAVPRVSFDGNSLAADIFLIASKLKLKLAIVGGVPGVAERASVVFKQRYELDIVSVHSGFFEPNTSRAEYCAELAGIQPDLVVCGMGAPYQEQFLLELKGAGWVGVGFTCGGYLDQASEGSVQYYPQWVNKLNLRALYRVAREPGRLGVRYLVHYAPFYIGMVGIYLRGFG